MDNHLFAFELFFRIIDHERHVRNGFDQFRIGRIIPLALPLNAVRIIFMIRYRHFQVRQIDFTFKAFMRGYPDMIRSHK